MGRYERSPLLLLLFVAGCRHPGGSTQANVDAGAPTAAVVRHPDSAAAIRSCTVGLARASKVAVAEKAPVMMAECRGLYARPACRDAWLAGPLQVLAACRTAYCADLPAPKPVLCDALPAAASDQREAWPALNDAILAFDHGLGADTPAVTREFFRAYGQLQRLLFVGHGVTITQPAAGAHGP